MGIYVETFINGSMDDVWRATQTPDLHARWDLRFTDIAYLPRVGESAPQRFLYSTRIGFGLCVRGEGETVGSRDDGRGRRSSALKFWSHDPKSLILRGSGYWQYRAEEGGVRFLTWYDYTTRFGTLGRAIDALIFRPLLGWATAWSFDRLRLWIERGVDPRLALERGLVQGLARAGLGFVWLYQGLVPKLLFRHVDELAMLTAAGVPFAAAPSLLLLLGGAELLLGLLFLLGYSLRRLFLLTAGLMLLASLAVVASAPGALVAPFNPLTLNGAVLALAVAGFLSGDEIPSARRCRRTRPERER